LGFYTTKAYKNATVSLKAGNKVITEENIAIDPGKPFNKQIALPAGLDEHDLRASISVGGRELVAYSPIRLQQTSKPEATTIPAAPSEIKNDEELFLAGQRIDQFHNPNLDANPYWEEVLRRDAGNVAANTGMGLLNLRNAEFAVAESYFRKANDRLTAQYTTPKNAEPTYYLGVSLKAQERLDEAFSAFFKATWSQEWKSPAYYSIAEIASIRGDFTASLNYVNSSLDANALNVRAYGLKAAVLRHLNRNDVAIQTIAFAKDKTDPLDVRLMTEQWLLTKDSKIAETLFSTLNTYPATAQEAAAEYFNAGLWSDGIAILLQTIATAPDQIKVSPIVYYYLGYFSEKLGDLTKAAEYRKQATLQSADYVFPFQSEVITVLRHAIEANPQDAQAPYYLGNLLFDWQPNEAVALWEKSAALDPQSVTFRNLAQAYSHKTGDEPRAKAIAYMEKAVALSNPNPTHFAELDLLYKSAGTSVEKRLALLEKNQKVVVLKDESLGDLINLKTFAGKADESILLLKGRVFSIWEGDNAFNTGQAWTNAHLVRGLQRYGLKKYNEAIDDFETALNLPENLRAEQQFDKHGIEIAYWKGCSYAALGEKEKAQQAWNEAIAADTKANLEESKHGEEPNQIAVNSQASTVGGSHKSKNNLHSDGYQRYYVALIQQKLGNNAVNEVLFNELVASATSALNQAANAGDKNSQDSNHQRSQMNIAMAHYMAGLGYTGLGNKSKAREEFNNALHSIPDFLNAKIALNQLDFKGI